MRTPNDVDRRRLLEALGLGLLWPVIGHARTGTAAAQDEEAAGGFELVFGKPNLGPNPYVEPALRRAWELGKPLLVLVVTEDGETWWGRQHAFGELLNHGSDAVLVDLALCEVLVASRADLARHVTGAAGEAGEGPEPLLILVGVDGALRAVPDELPPVPDFPWRGDSKEHAEAVRARIAAFEQLLHELLAPDAEALARHADAAREVLAAERVERAATVCEGSDALDPRAADEAAALVRVRLAATDVPEQRECLLDSLLAGTTHRLRKGPPLGARWATNWGCGTTLEKVPDGHAAEGEFGEPVRIMCGMGHVPEISRRFLWFWGQGGSF